MLPKIEPMILWNAKDDPMLSSGYGIITRYVVPRLADHYGKDRIIIYAPVYNSRQVHDWEGITVVPGNDLSFGENMIMDHYREYGCNLLLQVGDAWPLGQLPDLAAANQVMWVQWLPVDWIGMPKNIVNRIRSAYKLIAFSQHGEKQLRQANMNNVGKAIWLGLDLDIWKPIPREELPGIMSSLGFDYDTFNVLIVGANQVRKRMREGLEAIALFRHVNPEVPIRLYLHTEMVGERDFRADIDELGLAEIFVHPDPYIMSQGGFPEEQMAMIFNCADVVINLAMEGFGFAYTQAQACGVPVIHMSEGAGPELVQFGWEIPIAGQETSPQQMTQPLPNTIAAAACLGDVIKRRMEAEQPLRSLAAVKWAQDNLGWDCIAAQWIEVIDQCMEDRRRYCYDEPRADKDSELWQKSRELVTVPSVERKD